MSEINLMKLFDEEIIRKILMSSNLMRLKYVSLSNVPPRLVPWLPWATRLDHSLDTAALTYVVRDHLGLERETFYLILLSALLHDAAIPPFGHISDEFLREIYGVEHEDALCRIEFPYPNAADIVGDFGYSIYEICEVISGSHEFSPVISGKIDLDNISNMHMGLQTMVPPRMAYYHPIEMAKKIDLRGNKIGVFDKAYIEKWIKTRELYYTLLEEDAGNIYVGSFLKKYIEILFDEKEIGKRFFIMNNDEALSFINERLGIGFLKDRGYLLELKIRNKLPELSRKKRKNLEYDLAQQLNLEYENVVISMFKTSTKRYIGEYYNNNGRTEKPPYFLLFISIHSKNELKESAISSLEKYLPIDASAIMHKRVKKVKIHTVKRSLRD